LAAFLQAAGYVLYVRKSLASEIEPNPLTWLMFAYGTSLLAFIEFENGAGWQELALPITCATGSVTVAAICMARGRMHLPESRLEVTAFAGDVALTVAYVGFWLADDGVFASGDAAYQVGFLIASNTTAVTAFVPLLASTWAEPSQESRGPWIIWTGAYAGLLAATLVNEGGSGNPWLLMYPALNMLLHAGVALITVTGAKSANRRSAEDLFVADAPGKGRGLFARRPFAKGELVFELTGRVRRIEIRTAKQSARYENWLGLDADLHRLPDEPYVFANHSCTPNLGVRDRTSFVALSNILPGDELTYDYATVCAELNWSMRCRCDHPNCRTTIKGIQSLPQDVFDSYLPFIPPYFQSVYRADQDRATKKVNLEGREVLEDACCA